MLTREVYGNVKGGKVADAFISQHSHGSSSRYKLPAQPQIPSNRTPGHGLKCDVYETLPMSFYLLISPATDECLRVNLPQFASIKSQLNYCRVGCQCVWFICWFGTLLCMGEVRAAWYQENDGSEVRQSHNGGICRVPLYVRHREHCLPCPKCAYRSLEMVTCILCWASQSMRCQVPGVFVLQLVCTLSFSELIS